MLRLTFISKRLYAFVLMLKFDKMLSFTLDLYLNEMVNDVVFQVENIFLGLFHVKK